jgi:hypothetical protein
MTEKRIIPIEVGQKIQLPAEWVEDLGLDGIATVEKTSSGILVRPCQFTWDEIFAEKLPLGQRVATQDLSELSGDDLIL